MALIKDPKVLSALYLCHSKQKFLYEAFPCLIPYSNGFCSEVELNLWALFFDRMKEQNGK